MFFQEKNKRNMDNYESRSRPQTSGERRIQERCGTVVKVSDSFPF
jgi:hypothetical protein